MFLSDSPAHEIGDTGALFSEVGGIYVGAECVLAPLNDVSGFVGELSEWCEKLECILFRIMGRFIEDPRCVIDTFGHAGGGGPNGPVVGCWIKSHSPWSAARLMGPVSVPLLFLGRVGMVQRESRRVSLCCYLLLGCVGMVQRESPHVSLCCYLLLWRVGMVQRESRRVSLCYLLLWRVGMVQRESRRVSLCCYLLLGCVGMVQRESRRVSLCCYLLLGCVGMVQRESPHVSLCCYLLLWRVGMVQRESRRVSLCYLLLWRVGMVQRESRRVSLCCYLLLRARGGGTTGESACVALLLSVREFPSQGLAPPSGKLVCWQLSVRESSVVGLAVPVSFWWY